jgi:uncharacterized membrane protein
MKLTRAIYPAFFAILLIGVIFSTIDKFSVQLADILAIPFIIIALGLLILSLILYKKDKEFIYVQSDERSKRVDRSAGYYSWWFTIITFGIIGPIAAYFEFTIIQFTFVIITFMLLSMFFMHMYFNFFGNM